MSTTEYQMCARCVMDTSDPEITFDGEGVCNHCREFDAVTSKRWFPNDEGAERLAALINKVQREGSGREYDCILGLSGGVDSSYLALKAHEWGIRPLVVHVDAGWNSELAVANIEKIVTFCGYDLHTRVIDWEEMRDLQLAYLRSGIPNQDVPQDHAFFASTYHFAVQNNIKYILSGGNIATEGVFPATWHNSAMDEINLRAIHRRFGMHRLQDYQTISFFDYYIWYPFVKGMRALRPLDYMPYNKDAAINELVCTVGWKPYERKHGESIFTQFFQNYYLPTRFGYDKRRPHFSSLIVSGQMSREVAMHKLCNSLYDEPQLIADKLYLCKKLRISVEELNNLVASPLHKHTDYPNWDQRRSVIKKLQGLYGGVRGRPLTVYT